MQFNKTLRQILKLVVHKIRLQSEIAIKLIEDILVISFSWLS